MTKALSLFVLGLVAAAGCIVVERSPSTEPFDDKKPLPDSGAQPLPDSGALVDGAATPPEAGTGPLACQPQSGSSFCENFDTQDLPGAFNKPEVSSDASLTATSGPATSGARSLKATLAASTSSSIARLYRRFPSAKEVEVEFDFRPEQLHNGSTPSSSYVAQIYTYQTAPANNRSVIGGLQIEALDGQGSLFAMGYVGGTDAFRRIGNPVPVKAGVWTRLRLLFNSNGNIEMREVTKGAALLLSQGTVPVPSSLEPGLTLSIGAETFDPHKGWSFLYDTVVVNAR